MKKIISTLLALAAVMMFGFVGSVAAFDEHPVTVTAYVAPYATITGSLIAIADFDGTDGDTKAGTCEIGVETNHKVTITPAVTTHLNNSDTGGNDTITTTCDIDGYASVDQDYNSVTSGAVTHIINAQGELGIISDQAAGNYDAEITVTVASYEGT